MRLKDDRARLNESIDAIEHSALTWTGPAWRQRLRLEVVEDLRGRRSKQVLLPSPEREARSLWTGYERLYASLLLQVMRREVESVTRKPPSAELERAAPGSVAPHGRIRSEVTRTVLSGL